MSIQRALTQSAGPTMTVVKWTFSQGGAVPVHLVAQHPKLVKPRVCTKYRKMRKL